MKDSLLELEININHRGFGSELYAKWDAFLFCIVSAISIFIMPAKMFHAARESEIFCLERLTSSKEKFQNLITALLTKIHKQGCQNTQLQRLLNKLFGKHSATATFSKIIHLTILNNFYWSVAEWVRKRTNFCSQTGILRILRILRIFKDFCHCIRLKWYFRDEPTPFFSEKPSFSPKSFWSPPVGHSNVEEFINQWWTWVILDSW